MLKPPLIDVKKVSIETIAASDHPRAQSFYQSVGYIQPIQPADIVITATLNTEVIGVVRLANELGYTILRGMHIAKEHQRNGIGSLMIKELEKHIGSVDCFCLPHGWLESFYGQIGFVKVFDGELPTHLQERLEENRKKYQQLIGMKRPSTVTI